MYAWGVRELDALCGGMEKSLWLFYGRTGVGKTTLSSYVPIARISKHFIEGIGGIPEDGRFVVMDGDGGFAVERLVEVLENNDIPAKEVLGKLVHVEFTTFKEQHSFICGPSRRKEEEAEEEEEAPEEKALPQRMREMLREVSSVGLESWIEKKKIRPLSFSFDPMTAIYRGILLRTPIASRSVAMQPYAGKLDLQLATMRRLGVIFGCPVFVTTWPSSPVGRALAKKESVPPEFPFIGGRSFGFFPKQIWELRMPEEGQPVRVAVVYKSRTSPSGRSGRFKLSAKGIEEV